jgi:hypothetical protein
MDEQPVIEQLLNCPEKLATSPRQERYVMECLSPSASVEENFR